MQIVREMSCNNRRVRARSCTGNVLSGKRLSGKVIVRETSVTRQFDRPMSNGMAALSRKDTMPQSFAVLTPTPRMPCSNAVNRENARLGCKVNFAPDKFCYGQLRSI